MPARCPRPRSVRLSPTVGREWGVIPSESLLVSDMADVGAASKIARYASLRVVQ